MKIRTGYSFGAAVGHLPDVISRIKEIGWKEAPISDRQSTYAFTRWKKEAEKAGLRPIFGVELAVVPVLGEKLPIADYWTFFATNDIKSINDLIYTATDAPNKFPALTYAQAMAAKGVIKITGERVLLENIKPQKDLYIGLSPSLSKGLFNAAQKKKFQFIATSDNYFPRADDLEFYRIALGGRAGTQTWPQHILSDKEWEASVQGEIKSALANRKKAFASCKAKLKTATLLSPDKPKTLRKMCEEGAKRVGINLKDKIYSQRLDRELSLIKQKNFDDYFYIIADLVQYAKKKMIVGPARGSSCGSLVCYLLDITAIDPIPFGLIFERFIDITRTDLPDIDIDFSDENRNLVFEYAENKYGKDRVARLGTVGLFKPRSALKQAGAELRIPGWMIEKVLDGLIERSGGDARALQALEDTLQSTEAGQRMLKEYPECLIAARMEGHPNNPSQHAAGIVLTQEPVTEFVAVDARTRSSMCDKKAAEDLGLLKIDALGLTQLSIFERTLELIGEKPISGWLEKIPMEDKKAFKILNDGHFAGIFQFTGIALQSLCKQITVESLEDMISITALARPGPLATGGANSWIKRRLGREKITTLHPLLTNLTKDTYGIIIYQEQVMNIVRELGKMSWEDTSSIRKGMSGSLGDEFFARYWEKFEKGAIENGITPKIAREIWDQINTFGSWAFNRSHAVAYGMVSYWCTWLKAHHPLEFAAATLDAESDPSKQITLLRELKEEGIDYKPFDLDHSTDRWTPVKKNKKMLLVGPLTSIHGIGPSTVAEILDSRMNGVKIRGALQKRLDNAKTKIDSLFPVTDRIKALHPDLTKVNIFTKPTPIKKVQPGIKGEVVVLAIAKTIAPLDENEPQRVLKRGGKLYYGKTKAVNLFVMDDTDEIFAKVTVQFYDAIGKDVAERGKAGKALYAIKGTVPENFRMIRISQMKYLGDLE